MCLWEKTKKMTLSQGLKKSFSQQHMLVDFEYVFLNESLALKFGTHVINIEMGSCQKYHGKKTNFQPLGGCQSWQ